VGRDREVDAQSLRRRGEPIEPQLLQILACPLEASRPKLELKGDLLVCTSCGCGFRIIDGIPDLLPEDAVPAEEVKELLRG
jgi:uncharacterized protein YbaR (Trm112 family)